MLLHVKARSSPLRHPVCKAVNTSGLQIAHVREELALVMPQVLEVADEKKKRP